MFTLKLSGIQIVFTSISYRLIESIGITVGIDKLKNSIKHTYLTRSCENLWLKKVIKGGPVRYIAPETKDVWFCNCKQTGMYNF